jgi:hypothetical protein
MKTTVKTKPTVELTTKQCGFALLDVKTKKANKAIDDARKQGYRVKVTLTGYMDEADWSNWDGISIEQSLAITSIKSTLVPVTPAKTTPRVKTKPKMQGK